MGTELWTRHTGTLRLAGVVAILLFSFWAGMGPHWDYRYPLHVDEWFAIGYAQSTLEAGGLQYPNPYARWEVSFHPEMGFHLVLGFLKATTGLSWMGLYRVAPGILMVLLTFLTYAFARRSGFGWAAAIFVPLIPSSIRTLGPAFVVPVSAAMLFIPVTLLVLHHMGEESRGKSLWVLLLLIGGTIFVHPTTEGVVTALAILYLAGFVVQAVGRRRYREGANLVLAIGVRMLIPIVILGVWLPTITRKVLEQSTTGDAGQFSGLFQTLGPHTGFAEAFGIVAVGISIIGVFLFVARGDLGVRSYLLPAFTFLLLAFLYFFFPEYQRGPGVLYSRGWSYLGLLLAIFAGYGVALYFRSIPAIARAATSRTHRSLAGAANISLWAIGVAVVVFAITTGLVTNEKREEYPSYYHVVDRSVFADFVWIGRHANNDQTIAMGEPTIGWAYPPIAGSGASVVTAVASPWTNSNANRLRRMLSTGEADVPWLRKQDVSVLYTCVPVTFTCEELTSQDLFEVRRGVYVLPDSDTE